MNDESKQAGGEENGGYADSSQPPTGALRPIERDALARRPGFTNESSASANRESPNSGGGITSYLHAYRRRWLLATFLGLVFGVAAAVAAWLSATPAYTSTALIRIAANNQGIVYQDDKGQTSFDLYKGTQMQLLTSDFVLIAALRDNPKVSNLDVVKQEVDPVRWLSKTLNVQAPETRSFCG